MTRPPGSALLLLFFGAGLVTGLSHFPDPRIAFFGMLVAAGLVRQSIGQVALVAAAFGIVAGAIASRPAPDGCASALKDGDITLHVRLDEPGGGGMIRATSIDRRCNGSVRLRWPAGHATASGSAVHVAGKWVRRDGAFGSPGGFLVVRRVSVASGSRRQLRDRIHDGVAARTQRLFGARAPLVDALVTGRRGEMPDELKTAFSAAGLVHLLSISGFHIGLIAGWILLVLKVCRCRRHLAEGLAATLSLAYVAFLGWPAPAARAGWLLLLVAWNRQRQRNVGPVALLAMSCLCVVVFDPWAIVDLGGWLSASALLGAVTLTRWSDRTLGKSWGWQTLCASVGATLGTAPLTAMAFGQVALIGVALNFIAIPLAAAAVPAVVFAILLEPVAPSLAASFAAAGGTTLALIERVATIGASIPFGQWITDPGVMAVVPWVLAMGVMMLAIRGGATAREAGRRLAWAAVAGCWVVLGTSIPHPGGAGRLTLHFLNVGQGDAAMIRTPAGRWIAVDAGPASMTGDAGQRVLLPFLRRQAARRIDVFVLSHAHRDHVGGAASLMRAVAVSVAIDPGMTFDDGSYRDWLGTAAEREVRWRRGEAGEEWTIDGVRFRLLHPTRNWSGSGLDLNEDSIVLEVRYGDFSALFTGDTGFAAESAFAGAVREVDVLKVGHHGSRGSTGDGLLAAAVPRIAIVSLGTNRYGHPAPETMKRLARAGVRTLRTDAEGTIMVTTDGRTFDVKGRRTRLTLDASPENRHQE